MSGQKKGFVTYRPALWHELRVRELVRAPHEVSIFRLYRVMCVSEGWKGFMETASEPWKWGGLLCVAHFIYFSLLAAQIIHSPLGQHFFFFNVTRNSPRLRDADATPPVYLSLSLSLT